MPRWLWRLLIWLRGKQQPKPESYPYDENAGIPCSGVEEQDR